MSSVFLPTTTCPTQFPRSSPHLNSTIKIKIFKSYSKCNCKCFSSLQIYKFFHELWSEGYENMWAYLLSLCTFLFYLISFEFLKIKYIKYKTIIGFWYKSMEIYGIQKRWVEKKPWIFDLSLIISLLSL